MRLPGPRLRRFALFDGTILAAILAGTIAANALPSTPIPTAPSGTPALTRDDVVRLHAAVARLNQGQSIGAVERWRSQVSRDAGEVVLARSFAAGGMPCHAIRYVIRYRAAPASPARFAFTWCRLPDGGWKIFDPEDLKK